MKKIIFIGLGGVFGALLRYILITYLPSHDYFPLALLSINFLGCFLLGFLRQKIILHELNLPFINDFLIIGFLGSLTTFSSFAIDNVHLSHNFLLLSLNIIASTFLCLFGVYFGVKLARGKKSEREK